jgi:OOP family OmpA-OmpF porin
MRSLSKFALAASLTLALPATAFAQRQGAIEIGGFGRYTKFADTLRVESGAGAGGRAGVYILKNLMLEMDVSYANLDVSARALGTGVPGVDTLTKVSHTLWSYRLLYNQPLSDRVKLLLGGGYGYDAFGRARTVAPRSGGPQGLAGLRFIINDRLSARVEGIGQYNVQVEEREGIPETPSHFNLGAQAGLSLSFFGKEKVVPAPAVTERIVRDTVYVTRIDTVRVTVPGEPIVIGAINFAFAKSDISNEAKAILDKIAESLTKPVNSSRTILVTGNTDAIGSERFNLRLGQERADQAKAYLVSKGVAESRITARSAGESDPVAPNTTDNGRATNRRVLVMLNN